MFVISWMVGTICALTCAEMSHQHTRMNTGTVLSGWCWGDISTEWGRTAISIGYNKRADFTFERCGFYNLTAGANNGGAVSLGLRGTHRFLFCEFKRVSTGVNGGAFWAGEAVNLIVHECLFDNVTAREGNGGVFVTFLPDIGGSLQVSNSEFIQCTCGTGSKGSICFCQTPLTKPLLANCTFDNCTISCSDTEKSMKYAIYFEIRGTEVPFTFRKCVFDLDVAFDSLFLFDTVGPVVFESDIFRRTKTQAPLIKYTWEAWKSVDVLNCEFSQATGTCDGVAIDTDRVSSATISNCTFDHCASQKPELGGVVIVRPATTDCQIYDCHFIANSCQNQTLSLRLMVISSITVTGCRFSSHVGAFPVLKADGEGALLSICDCCFEDNVLDAGRTGIIAFPEGKSASLIHCQFLSNQATVTLSKCSKFSFDSCYFLVLPGKAFYPIIRDNGTPRIKIARSSFGNLGAEPAGGSFCVRIDNKDCQVTVSRSCFGSSRDSAISGGQQHVTDTVFGEDCQPPDWDPSESVEPDPESESPWDPDESTAPPFPADSDFPTGAVVGGVLGGVAFVAIVCGVAYGLVRRKRKGNGTEGVPQEPLLQ